MWKFRKFNYNTNLIDPLFESLFQLTSTYPTAISGLLTITGQRPDFKYKATLKDAFFTYLWRIRMPAWSEALCLKHGGILAA